MWRFSVHFCQIFHKRIYLEDFFKKNFNNFFLIAWKFFFFFLQTFLNKFEQFLANMSPINFRSSLFPRQLLKHLQNHVPCWQLLPSPAPLHKCQSPYSFYTNGQFSCPHSPTIPLELIWSYYEWSVLMFTSLFSQPTLKEPTPGSFIWRDLYVTWSKSQYLCIWTTSFCFWGKVTGICGSCGLSPDQRGWGQPPEMVMGTHLNILSGFWNFRH